MVQGKINRGRHTDHLAGRHSIRTNQCLPPPSPTVCCSGNLQIGARWRHCYNRQLQHCYNTQKWQRAVNSAIFDDLMSLSMSFIYCNPFLMWLVVQLVVIDRASCSPSVKLSLFNFICVIKVATRQRCGCISQTLQNIADETTELAELKKSWQNCSSQSWSCTPNETQIMFAAWCLQAVVLN